jgi:hypothetical protein
LHSFSFKLIWFTLSHLVTIRMLKLQSPFYSLLVVIKRQHLCSMLTNVRPGYTRQAMCV